MKEILIDIYELLVNDNIVIFSIVKKDENYIVEKCTVSNDCINLIYNETFNTFKKAKIVYNNLIATK